MAGGNTSTGDRHLGQVESAIALIAAPLAVHYPTIYRQSKGNAIAFAFNGQRCLALCMWQGVSGTVDEKYPFLFENATIQDGYSNVFIVLGGGGARAVAEEWIADSANVWNARGRRPRIEVFESSDAFRGACQRAAAGGEWTG